MMIMGSFGILILSIIFFSLGFLFWFAGGVNAIKSALPKRAKPKILQIGKRTIDWIGDISIELLIKNFGSKDCSLINIDLDWPKVIPWPKNSTALPKLIASGKTELIIISGRAAKGTTSGTISLMFDINKIIKKKIDFIVLTR